MTTSLIATSSNSNDILPEASHISLDVLICINNAYRPTLDNIADAFLSRPTNAEPNSCHNAGLAQLGVLRIKRTERAKASLRTLRCIRESRQIPRQTFVAELWQWLAPDVLRRRAEGVVAKKGPARRVACRKLSFLPRPEESRRRRSRTARRRGVKEGWWLGIRGWRLRWENGEAFFANRV